MSLTTNPMIFILRNEKNETMKKDSGDKVTQNLTLVSFDLCPYVQRASIVLSEKNIPFTRINVDLSNKPNWYKAISPLGKVPLLQAGGEVLFESAVIVEYLEEVFQPKLHPADPLTKARHRALGEFGSSILADIWVVETTKDQTAFDTKVATMREKFIRLETLLGDGPFFSGMNFCIVDAVFAPVFRYFDVFDTIVDLGVFHGLTKVQAWRSALATRPSVKAAVVSDYPSRLHAFICRQNGHLAMLALQGAA